MNLLEQQRSFSVYGTSHWAVVVLLTVVAVLLGWFGHRYRDGQRVIFGARVFAIVIVVFQVPLQIYAFTPGKWNLGWSLPFQLCDLAWMAAAYALWSRRQWAYSCTYYWGFTLVPQAIITPALTGPETDFPSASFIMFWGQHCLVLWAAVYLTFWLRMRPGWHSLWTAVWITLVWGAFAFTFNELAGTNYGFLNTKPTNPSILDLMGGWPGYLAVEFVVGLAGWALVTWPWTRARSRREMAESTVRS